MFITEQDYIQVSADALRIIQQATDDNRLLDGRYDMQAAFTAEGEARNLDLVGLVADLALYFMVLSLPQKMGYEIRKEQFENAVAYLEKVQAGKAVMNLPELQPTGEEGEQTGAGIRYGSDKRNNYIW